MWYELFGESLYNLSLVRAIQKADSDEFKIITLIHGPPNDHIFVYFNNEEERDKCYDEIKAFLLPEGME